MKTCFPEEINPRKNNKVSTLNTVHTLEEDPLYILVWYNCDLCRDLVLELEKLNIKYLYINSGIYFDDVEIKDSVFQDPLFYKDEILIGENLYDIYEEIYKVHDY